MFIPLDSQTRRLLVHVVPDARKGFGLPPGENKAEPCEKKKAKTLAYINSRKAGTHLKYKTRNYEASIASG